MADGIEEYNYKRHIGTEHHNKGIVYSLIVYPLRLSRTNLPSTLGERYRFTTI